MVVRRFWTGGEQESAFMRTLDSRFRLVNDLLDSDSIRIALGRGPVTAPAAIAQSAKVSAVGSSNAAWVSPNAGEGVEADLIAPIIVSFLSPSGGGDFVMFHEMSGGLIGDAPLLIDSKKMEIVSLVVNGDHADPLSGHDDQLVFSGGLPEDARLGGAAAGHEQLIFTGNKDYSLGASDADVGLGQTLTVIGTALGGHGLDFDGSAELDGAYSFVGGNGSDRFIGGAGDDDFYGSNGGDLLAGGGGADVFHYARVSESTGSGYDSLSGFDFGSDKIDLPGSVTAMDAAIGQGALSTASFDSDLSAALSGKLGAGHAAFFTADSGDLAGQTFLVVDGNGQAGYQAGQDYVFHLDNPPPPDLGGVSFFV
jgi:hypothetical protein